MNTDETDSMSLKNLVNRILRMRQELDWADETIRLLEARIAALEQGAVIVNVQQGEQK